MHKPLHVPCLITLLLVASAAGAEQVGWRGDGTGRYPRAEPPLTWSRIARSVKALRAQAEEPKAGETGAPIPDGVIREWLILGPIAVPEGFKKMQDELLAGESAWAPKVGDKAAAAIWKKANCETASVSFRKLFGIETLTPDMPTQAAYCCARLYSESGAPLRMNLMKAAKDLQLWLNGELVKGAAVTVLKLNKGWNRLLFRVISPNDKSNGSWYIRPVFFGAGDCAYDSEHILWARKTPGVGIGSPIVVGDRVFFTANMCNLICADKRTGKTLWVRSSTYFDGLSTAEKKTHAAALAELVPLDTKLKELDAALAGDSEPEAVACKEKADIEMKIHKLMKGVDAEKYNLPGVGEAGWAPMTPVSDGKHVYVAFATGTLACFDLDGKRVWTALEIHNPGEHGFTGSPVLQDGNLVMYFDRLIALDGQTGQRVWATDTRPEKGGLNTYKIHGTVCPIKVGGEGAIFTGQGQLIRTRDGKSLYFEFYKAGKGRCTSPIAEGDLIFNLSGEGALRILSFPYIADAVQPSKLQTVTIDTRNFPAWFGGAFMASPLYHEGLLYCVNMDGVLTVVDAKAETVVYQKLLDADLFAAHQGWWAGRGQLGSSPALGGKHLFVFGNQGTALVLEPGRVFKQVSKNRLECQMSNGNAQEVITTCPVFDGKRIYVRAEEHLYCIGAE
ncbi:MAG: PQQ-like beta-propeller repeat protein [Planctomycetota bacterium]|nr:PQQ-like beta-propeller repeat protein [Planctomycetota bacterium]